MVVETASRVATEIAQETRGALPAPAPLQVRPPSSLAAPPLTASACNQDASPSAPALNDPVNTRLAELWDRARPILRGSSGSDELRSAMRALFVTERDPEDAFPLLASAPDRVVDGFDQLIAAHLLAGVRALKEDQRETLHRHADAARRLAPEDPLPDVLLALADPEERDALTRAFELDEEEPAVAFALAHRALKVADVELAARAIEAYLDVIPDDVYARALRERTLARVAVHRDMVTSERAGVSLHHARASSVSRDVHLAVLTGLENAARLLGTVRRETLTVVLYPNDEAMRASICAPSWTGALYDGVLHLSAARSSAQVVQHEALHAQLHEVAPRAPVWFHEGVAQYIAEERDPGVARSYTLMREQRTYIPFPSIEGSFVVIEDPGAARLAYHQSLALIELLVEREGEAVLPRAVTLLNALDEPLLPRLTTPPLTGDDLLHWLDVQANP